MSERYTQVKHVPLTHTEEAGRVFDQMFYDGIDEGFKPEDLVPKIIIDDNETALERMIRERKEKLDED